MLTYAGADCASSQHKQALARAYYRYSVYLLYSYKSTNTDTLARAYYSDGPEAEAEVEPYTLNKKGL